MASFLNKKKQIHRNGGCTTGSSKRATMSKFSSLSSFLTSYRLGVPELIQLGDDAADEGIFEDSLTHYNNALEKERHTASGASSFSVEPTICLTTPPWRSIHGLNFMSFTDIIQKKRDAYSASRSSNQISFQLQAHYLMRPLDLFRPV